MRLLTKNEGNRLKFLTKNSVSFTLIEPTETALKKGIIDATGVVRSYLKNSDCHNYETQGQGAKENGVKIQSIIYNDYSLIKTTASLYRPKAKDKGGDPRIWFYGLHNVCNANDILVLVYFDRKIHVINLTQLDFISLLNSLIINPLKDLVQEINLVENVVSTELLSKLRNITSNGYVKSMVNADTGVGRTLETLLGIEMNSSKSPDYKGIELKSFRDNRGTRKGLFGKTPDWELSKFKSRIEILDNFGYVGDKGDFRIYNTIRATGRNAQGLILKIESEKDWLVENSDRVEIGDFLVWELEVLKKALIKKHKETFWISTDSKIIDGNEYFLYKEAEHTKNPLVNQFDLLIEMGAITMDYNIKRKLNGSVEDGGCNFKIKPNSLNLLFPPSQVYSLV
jgi:hypothetical protein